MTARYDNDRLSQAQTQRRKDEAVAKILNVDIRCIDLARHFLSDLALADDADVDELAQRIQATVEEFIDVAFNIPEPPNDEITP